MLPETNKLKPVDYLVIGHLACDRTQAGLRLGGTVAYSSLTARALGFNPGIVTSWGGEIPLDLLEGIQIYSLPTERSTTFENIYTSSGRLQVIHHQAAPIDYESVPDLWRQSPIIHLGPIAQELPIKQDSIISPSFLCVTPQGWMRSWDEAGHVLPNCCPDLSPLTSKAGATVISIEDVENDEAEIERLSLESRILAVTEGPAGARLYWNQDLRRFNAPKIKEIDATGAGDIFAAAFFTRLIATRDPWESARFATRLASFSVAREGLESIPTSQEIQASLMEVI